MLIRKGRPTTCQRAILMADRVVVMMKWSDGDVMALMMMVMARIVRLRRGSGAVVGYEIVVL